MLAMVRWMADDEPLPISIMTMTAATPMMIPRVVRCRAHGVAAEGPQGGADGAQYSE